MPAKLHMALEKEDYPKLKKYLHKDLAYTHSNGWTETKKELIENLKTDVLVYRKITLDSIQWRHYADSSVASFRSDVDVSLREKPIKISLQVEQCWIKKGKRWLLIRRKSSKIS
jgi:Domain of unknown function (DUF4440)